MNFILLSFALISGFASSISWISSFCFACSCLGGSFTGWFSGGLLFSSCLGTIWVFSSLCGGLGLGFWGGFSFSFFSSSSGAIWLSFNFGTSFTVVILSGLGFVTWILLSSGFGWFSPEFSIFWFN